MKVSERELATILAALRLFQSNYDSENSEYQEIFSLHFEDYTPLTNQEIDSLCERLNYEAET